MNALTDSLSMLRSSGASLFGQGSRLLKLRFSERSGISEEALLPHRIRGEERLSQTYRYELECLSPDVQLELKTLLGQAVEIALLNPAQRTQMFGAVNQWIYMNRRAEWSVIMGGRLSKAPAPGPLALSDEQLTAFLRASLADSLTPTLLNESATLSGMTPSARHQLVSHWIGLVEAQHGDAPDPGICLAYCQSQLAYV